MDLNTLLNMTPEQFAKAEKPQIKRTPRRVPSKPREAITPEWTKKQRFAMMTEAVKQPLILVDLDNTLMKFTWPGIERYDSFVLGEPLPGSQELCRKLVQLGTVEVTTSRMVLTEFTSTRPVTGNPQLDLSRHIKKWLVNNDFPLNMEVSLHRKPFCVAYIGDETFHPLNQTLTQDIEYLCNNYREAHQK
ncbi:MAG: hypothetical protein Unbinned400contig1000_44 [Prokaryotic dsDNA virus sp.]|mgnify:CR=1 FL=1|nr:MAG: hypothetical protein Unbinned400contig1000_44 [Prokaryotic dsDNA virus sp.]|tara:strand:- start:10134 stop:10703 length:570 start_codon:yes stop_codon:yes gene_type:complete